MQMTYLNLYYPEKITPCTQLYRVLILHHFSTDEDNFPMKKPAMATLRRIVILLLLATFVTTISAEAANQYYFRFQIKDRKELASLDKKITIDRCAPWDGQTVYAYANDQQYETFQTLGIPFELLTNPGELQEVRMSSTVREAQAWDSYPTFDAYKQMMEDFATNYPTLCVLDTIGYSEQGRELLAVKISDNATTEEAEPEVFYTSSMHGDETTGYVLMLRLIDSLLVSYGSDARITDMVDNMEIFINPLANPDGTYRGGNNTVFGAWRYNANGVDINRNFPDPQDGPHPDGNSYQDETLAMIDWADQHNFVISANFHGGTEVVNYPWDTWATLHADDSWYVSISHKYADTAQVASPSGYMDGFTDGITNGYDWYEVNGGRQDMMNFWYHCREVTIELSDTKLLSASQLPNHWNYNRKSLLSFLEEARYGITGIVTSSLTGLPLEALVTVVGHDTDSSQVRCDATHGDYHRMIGPGSWTLEFSALGYVTQTISGITVLSGQTTVQDVQLDPISTDPVLTLISESAPTVIDPGDNVGMTITLRNDGGGAATGVQGVLSTDDSNITINQPLSGFPTIAELGGTAVSQGSYSFSVSSSTPTYHQVDFRLDLTADGGYVDSAFFSLTIGLDVEDFETGDLSLYDWQSTGSAPWSVGSSTRYEGTYAAASGNIGNNQTSQLSVTVEVAQAGPISFEAKVSSESGFDYLRFLIDGIEKEKWSGEMDWTGKSYFVFPGSHTFTWRYTKDQSQANGSDKGWVDLIVFPALSEPTEPLVILTESLPDGWVGTAYSEQLSATGGSGNITWSDLNGDLAGTGLTLSSGGLVAGTPTSSGPVQFTARAADEGTLEVDKQYSMQMFLCGDADGGGAVAISDAVFVINFIFGGGPAPSPEALADADCSGTVSIGDAVYIIQFIFGGGPAPCAGCK